jgi:hypothetical protein
MPEMQDAWRNLLVSAAAIAIYRYWEAIIGPQGTPSQGSLPVLTACLFLFLVTFFRFLRGDEQYLERRYARVKQNVSISGLGRGLDVLSLLVHGVIFTGLGLSAIIPELFVRLYTLLLIVNSIWLWLNLQKETVMRRIVLGGEEGVWMSRSIEHDAAWLWIRNNFCTAFLLLFIELARVGGGLSESLCLALGLSACYLNSFVDLLFAWSFYFPRLRTK